MHEIIKKACGSKIPTEVSKKTFDEFFLPYLSTRKRGPKYKIGIFKMFNYILQILYTGAQWKSLSIEKDANGNNEIHYTSVYKIFARWTSYGSLMAAFNSSVVHLENNNMLDLTVLHGDGTCTIAKKGGDGLGYSGHKHYKGDKVVAITDNNSYVLAPFTVAPGNRNECILLPDCLEHLSKITKMAKLNLHHSILNLDPAYDSIKNRKLIFNRGMIPNIKENKRNRKGVKRGRKRIFSQEIYDLRLHTVERLFAWEDKFKRLLIRFERIQERHLNFKILAYTLINIRKFCT